MVRLIALVVVASALGVGGLAFAGAQEATPGRDPVGTPCPAGGRGSPVASPDASPAATPAASPGPAATGCGTPEAAGGGEEVAVVIEDFVYAPDPVEIAVGTTVTWTNRDRQYHTATTYPPEILQTGRLRQGESGSQTFEEPGTFEYFCEYHGNMKGTVVVR